MIRSSVIAVRRLSLIQDVGKLVENGKVYI